ncbi:MAG: chemotaxis protein CheW [Pelotomaculum sp.]|uniref:Chemotaxis protein CheW n=1 Tax=Pelotomaculum thermopropionicum (strain DSM 13744 / JCM 10971 / SI) TaxID=370438 RepID=A5D0E7_PELTS|nr:chemotaxis protein CheW [Pelotomaculum sp.]BAF60298.1 chemotaxis signal transduction protein [Pelotomaculum thermopropionicum SI]
MANEEKEAGSREEQLVVFQLAEQTYGIGIASVYEIIRMETITRVPRTPDFVEGVINLRGKIIPVIDLCKRFNLEVSERTGASRIIIVDVGGNTIGMIVDAVSEVLRVPADSIEPPPPMIHGISAAYLRGIAILDSRLIILLNLDKILYEQEKSELNGFVLETA